LQKFKNIKNRWYVYKHALYTKTAIVSPIFCRALKNKLNKLNENELN